MLDWHCDQLHHTHDSYNKTPSNLKYFKGVFLLISMSKLSISCNCLPISLINFSISCAFILTSLNNVSDNKHKNQKTPASLRS